MQQRNCCTAIRIGGSAIAEAPRDAPCYQIRDMFHEVWELERIQTAKATLKVIQWIGNGHMTLNTAVSGLLCHACTSSPTALYLSAHGI